MFNWGDLVGGSLVIFCFGLKLWAIIIIRLLEKQMGILNGLFVFIKGGLNKLVMKNKHMLLIECNSN